MSLPQNFTELKPQVTKFRAWLVERGSELLAPTNEWEILRFNAQGATAIIYQDKTGKLSWCNGAHKAFIAFKAPADPWRAIPRVRSQAASKAKRAVARTLIDRDGDACAMCGKPLGDDITIEHWVPLATGGTDHLANKILMHGECNKRGSHMNVRQKLELAIGSRMVT